MTPGLRARRGGALYPVLMIAAILLILSSMLPQVLVSSSHAQKNDLSRENLLSAAESGIAFAEARLKNEVVADVLAGSASSTDKWVMRPTHGNMDFGPKRTASYEVTLTMRQPPVKTVTGSKEVHQVTYRLQAVSSNPKGQTLKVGVAGLVTVECAIDTSGSGLPSRILKRVMVNGVNQEL